MRAVLTRVLWALCLVASFAGLPALSQTTTEPAPAVEPQPQGPAEVAMGAYVLRMSNVSPQAGSFDVDMWVWFRWKGPEIPYDSFEIVNGVITNKSEVQVEDDDGFNYATLRVQATVFHEFDVRRFPLDDHILPIVIEDSAAISRDLVYAPDEGIALDPAVDVAGWRVEMHPPTVETHHYETNYGLRSAGAAASDYSRLTFHIALERTSWAPLFKSFWISALSVLLGLLAFLIKADDLDARFGMGVGSIFAASANTFVITGSLPPTTAVTLAEQINLIAVGVIFAGVFVSIWSLRLRYQDREEDSLRLDRMAMIVLGVIYIVLNVLVMIFDLSGAPA